MNIEDFRAYCLGLPFATEDMPFDETVLVFRLKGKIFAAIILDKPQLVVLKCDEEKALELRENHSGIEPAHHWNKKYWNQIHLDQVTNNNLIQELIQHAYQETNKKLPKKDRVAL